MAAQSKPAADGEMTPASIMKILGPAVFLQVTAGAMLLQSRPQLAQHIMGGSAAESGLLLGKLVSGAAALELFINPIFGRMSDTWGRTLFLRVGCLVPMVLRALVFARPSLLTIGLDRVASPAVVTAWFSVMRAAQTDKMTVEELAKSQGPVAAFAGLGVMVAPFLDGLLTRLGGGPGTVNGLKLPFIGAAALSAVVSILFTTKYKETLADEDKRPMSWRECNPFSFFKMLRLGRSVRWLMITAGIQAFSEGRTITEINTIFCTNDLGWGTAGLTSFIAGYGVCVLIGGIFGGRQIDKLGQKTHTTVSNASNLVSFVLWGSATRSSSWMMWAALAVSILGQRKRDCVESIVTDLCVTPVSEGGGGLGKGEVAAALSNFRTLPAIIGPVTMGYLYSWATKTPEVRHIPGLPFYMLAGLMAVAEGAFQMLSKEEMGLDDRGNYVGIAAKTK